jgi:hypothetical protein
MNTNRSAKGSRPSARVMILCLVSCISLVAIAAEPAVPLARRGQRPPSLRSIVRRLELRVNRIEAMVEIMEQSASRYRVWRKCISELPVSEFGDQDHRFGFHYEERDGTGLDFRPALAVGSSGRRSEFRFLKFAHRDECQTDPTRPGTPGSPGTADPALAPDTGVPQRWSVEAPTKEWSVVDSLAGNPSIRSRLGRLERRQEDLWARAKRLDRMSEHFDEWESCLSSVPVTEYGDPEGHYGYRVDFGETGTEYAPALAVDISEWDDPDFMFLAFAGRDRPFTGRECEGLGDGEEVD